MIEPDTPVGISAPVISDLGGRITRVTHALPWALDHVHCYVVDEGDRATVIDCWPGRSADARELAACIGGAWLAARGPSDHYAFSSRSHRRQRGPGRSHRRVTTWFRAGLTRELSASVWTSTAPLEPYVDFFVEHGMPEQLARRSAEADTGSDVTLASPSQLVDDGDGLELGGERFQVRVLPGHADGHIVLVGEEYRTDVRWRCAAGRDHPQRRALAGVRTRSAGRISGTLRELDRLAPTVVYPGHGPAITAVSERAAEIAEHHADRLDAHVAALRAGADTAYAVARVLWPGETLSFHEQRFALVEALAHLERLEAEARASSPSPGRWRAL